RGVRADWPVFFFSSRSRHTISDRDWSSDVCSSDLTMARFTLTSEERAIVRNGGADLVLSARQASQKAMRPDLIATVERFSGRSKIGRASCRERVELAGVAGSAKRTSVNGRWRRLCD